MSENDNSTVEIDIGDTGASKHNPKRKRTVILISVVSAAVIITAILLYFFLIKIPFDEAVADFNNAVEDYNLVLVNLERGNQELNTSIASLHSLVTVDDLPIDETLLIDADVLLVEARNVIKEFAPISLEMPSRTGEINTATSEIVRLTSELTEAQLIYEIHIQQILDKSVAIFNHAVERCNLAIADLESKNQDLDDSIASLHALVLVANLPLDESLLAVPKSALEEARSVEKDSVPVIPDMPLAIEDINATTLEIVNIYKETVVMGDYGDTVTKLQEIYLEYESLIQQFQGAEVEFLWIDVDENATVLRFLTRIANSNSHALMGVTTQWTAFDENDAIVGFLGDRGKAFIPAGGYIYNVGGAGSANLSGTPNRVEVTVENEGVLTNREAPIISVSNIQIARSGIMYTVTAECITDSEIETTALSGSIILRDEDGHIIYADFWIPTGLPNILPENGSFILSNNFFNLPARPATAEVFVYYIG